MVTPFEVFVQYQLAMCDGWVKLMRESIDAYERLAEQQAKVLNSPGYLRLNDFIPTGADWLDHYGKRSHDVNVERV